MFLNFVLKEKFKPNFLAQTLIFLLNNLKIYFFLHYIITLACDMLIIEIQ